MEEYAANYSTVLLFALFIATLLIKLNTHKTKHICSQQISAQEKHSTHTCSQQKSVQDVVRIQTGKYDQNSNLHSFSTISDVS